MFAAILLVVTVAGCSGSKHARVRTATTGTTSTSTTETSVPPTSSTAAGPNGTIVAVTPPPTAPPRSTTTAGNLENDNFSYVVVTEADDGKSFTLHRSNQGIEVRLSTGEVWTEPDTSDPRVLARKAGTTNSDGSANATFDATSDGQATITAEGRSHPQPCQTAQPPCMIPDHVRAFHVNVTVVG
jgi:hypothetical protein